MRVTKDRTFIFTSRQKGVFYPPLGANQPLAPSIRTRSTVHSAQIGIHRVIRVRIGGRGRKWVFLSRRSQRGIAATK
jgi:hypothetical protein